MPENPVLNLASVEAWRVARGIDSISELARRSGIDRSYLSRIMSGKRPALPSHVAALAGALKVPPVVLVGPQTEHDLPEPVAS